MTTGPIGVVIATRNRRDELVRTLDALLDLPERPRVVVVDNGSTDGTDEVVDDRAGRRVELIRLVRNRGAAARNVGVEALDTPVVAFADDDSWWAPGALGHAVERFAREPALGLLAGRIEVGVERLPDPIEEQLATSPLGDDGRGPRILGFLACGAVVRRRAFLACGGFDAAFGVGGEEALLALDLAAAGWELRYDPHLVAVHRPSRARDEDDRRAVVVRNDLLVRWLRRPIRDAVGATLHVVGRGASDPASRRALRGLAARLPHIVRARRRVPDDIERAAALLDARLRAVSAA